MGKAAEFRERAAEFERDARLATLSVAREQYLLAASAWRKLADAEDQAEPAAEPRSFQPDAR